MDRYGIDFKKSQFYVKLVNSDWMKFEQNLNF